MREIEFKAKRLHSNEWVFGSLYVRTVDNIVKYYIIENVNRPWRRVTPETVCQWTGLLDKHGVKIFECDIFQYRKHDGYLLPDFTGEVLFMMGCFGYVATSENMGEAFRSFSEIDELKKDFLDHIEVTGNIHDNAQQKQALSDMMRGDEEIGLYDDNQKNH